MGLFSKHKDDADEKQTSQVKQATLSDSQKNSIPSGNNYYSSNSEGKGDLFPNTMGAQPNQQNGEFVNPFANDSSLNNPNNNGNINDIPIPKPNNVNQSQQVTTSEQMLSTEGMNSFNKVADSDFNNSTSNMNNLNSSNNMSFPSSSMNNVSSNKGSNLNKMPNSTTGNDFDASFSKGSMDKYDIQEMIDETVEKIIEEKWSNVVENIDRVLKWKEKKDAEINMLKEDLVNIADNFNKLETKLINKITSYDKNILDVNSEIKALEKVFQKITPTLINNVNELSKIADDLKGVKDRGKDKE